MSEWEAEVKIWRKGRLSRRERALGATALAAIESATNDLVRDLELEEVDRDR